ncbi:MAG: cytochrome c maturation protein CcmE [Hyphomicrobiaceae bacterium TMED74]|nr:cytochrome c maturation protein CcmE [Filomicrobium sp.]RPG38397.1 MAG: cytochrome c maturation protein CcmE [Hyphomicrobiaceae bacterium TMED74]
MTRKQRRGLLIGGGVAVLAVSLILVLFAMRGAIVYFYTPSDVVTKSVEPGQRFRLGGLVAGGSVDRGEGTKVGFSVTDTLQIIKVRYDGVLPDLFREGQGVIAEGKLDGSGIFQADTVLAKHDENYMPPEVAKSLKEKGIKLGKGAVHPTKQ